MRLTILTALLATTFVTVPLHAQENFGGNKPNPDKPFVATPVATFEFPWSMTFLADGWMLVNEKPGRIWLVDGKGTKVPVANVPAVEYKGQGGLLFVTTSPNYARDHQVYITYSEPGEGGSSLALARAKLTIGTGTASLDGLKVLWREFPKGQGGQFGGYIAFAPDKKSLFLTVGERQRFTPAQDPNTELGKILHLTLDGKPAAGNPMAGKTGADTLPLFAPPKDTEAAKTVTPTQVKLPGPNLAPSETWATGFRTPYGLAFDSAGRLWEVEHGPRGGDELNLIERGKNYGWPLVSYGMNYDGVPIPNPDTRPDLQKPALYWVPVIAPAGLTFYKGKLFPQWNGSAFIGGLGSQSLVRVAFDGTKAREAERWAMGARIRFTAEGPDGALYVLEDAKEGHLVRLTPKP
ncbi:PQQ-dependent sugar dehydrogenase [Sphingomonas sp. MMS24-J13]|uniref:PQQ-dependent sugar dehydrogenase n=1 Tax=Sphingomonas sp. MMS24-J13 TaxID=3238686 RepID=UPI00384FB2BE